MADVTPVQLAAYDQALADIDHNLKVLIDLFRNGDPHSPEHIRVAGFCRFLQDWSQFNVEALAEHLAVAIRRLDEIDRERHTSSRNRTKGGTDGG